MDIHVGVVDTGMHGQHKRTICSACEPCCAIKSKYTVIKYFASYDYLYVLS